MNRVKRIIQYSCFDTIEGDINGSGIHIAVMDTGISRHPDLTEQILGFYDFVNHKKKPYDDCSHGTHVCGILVGEGRMSDKKYSGIAPGSKVLMLKVLDENGNGSFLNVFSGLEWLLSHYKKYDIRMVNISVGTLPSSDAKNEKHLLELVDALWDEGLVVVAAAGNYGPNSGSIAIPGCSRKIITVGSSDDLTVGKAINIRKHYSGRGPTTECVMKPDVVAPGTGIYSCNALYRKKGMSPYVMKSGTSMATPVVTGALALLLSKNSEMTNAEVKLYLRERCKKLNIPDNQQGWGEINIKRLLHT